MPRFNIINVGTKEPVTVYRLTAICGAANGVYMDDGNGIALFTNGSRANQYARYMTEYSNDGKYQPRPVMADDWEHREIERLMDGTYTLLPWVGADGVSQSDPLSRESWFLSLRSAEAHKHYAHVSSTVPGNIAFTEDADKGSRDIQTSMRPGRYLKRFYGGRIDDTQIRQFANEFMAKHGVYELKFATTRDEIRAVYENGPSSCMSHKAREFRCGTDDKGHRIHPTEVYAAGDLAVSYLLACPLSPSADKEDAREDREVHIIARALCWPIKKTYGRIYGDAHKMYEFLHNAGYDKQEDWHFKGARLLKIEVSRGTYVMPYIDGDYRSLTDDGEFLVISDGGRITGEVTDGITYSNRIECYICGGECDDELEVDGHYFCESCYDDETFECDRLHRRFYGTCIEMGNGEYWSQRAVDRYAFSCDATNMLWPMPEQVIMWNGYAWCREHFQENGFTCDGDGLNYPNEMMQEDRSNPSQRAFYSIPWCTANPVPGWDTPVITEFVEPPIIPEVVSIEVDWGGILSVSTEEQRRFEQ